MKYKKYIIFDFDGTIYNSGPGVMKASRYALESFGIEVKNLNDLRGFNGPPLWDSFMKFYGFSREKADEAIKNTGSTIMFWVCMTVRYTPASRAVARPPCRRKNLVLATESPAVFPRVAYRSRSGRILRHYCWRNK